jgi:chromosome segregation ATPase
MTIRGLRKRLEELEQELARGHNVGCNEALSEAQARAEKAEHERDSYRRDFDAAANALDKLQADLDAALDLVLANEKGISAIASEITDLDIGPLKTWRDLMLRCRDEWRASPNYQRILALLEKRRQRG